jgi:hypothetical protein
MVLRIMWFLLLMPLVQAEEMNLFEHSFIHCGKSYKAKRGLLFNAFTHPTLCPDGEIAYPTTDILCFESVEIIDRCKGAIECKAKFACRIKDFKINQRELIKKVELDQEIPLYRVKVINASEKVINIVVEEEEKKEEKKVDKFNKAFYNKIRKKKKK